MDLTSSDEYEVNDCAIHKYRVLPWPSLEGNIHTYPDIF